MAWRATLCNSGFSIPYCALHVTLLQYQGKVLFCRKQGLPGQEHEHHQGGGKPSPYPIRVGAGLAPALVVPLAYAIGLGRGIMSSSATAQEHTFIGPGLSP